MKVCIGVVGECACVRNTMWMQRLLQPVREQNHGCIGLRFLEGQS